MNHLTQTPAPTLTRKQLSERYTSLARAMDIVVEKIGIDPFWLDMARDDTAVTTGPTTEAGIYLSQAADDLYALAVLVDHLPAATMAERIRSVRDYITFALTAFEEEEPR